MNKWIVGIPYVCMSVCLSTCGSVCRTLSCY